MRRVVPLHNSRDVCHQSSLSTYRRSTSCSCAANIAHWNRATAEYIRCLTTRICQRPCVLAATIIANKHRRPNRHNTGGCYRGTMDEQYSLGWSLRNACSPSEVIPQCKMLNNQWVYYIVCIVIMSICYCQRCFVHATWFLKSGAIIEL